MAKEVLLTWYDDCAIKREDRVYLASDDDPLICMRTGEPAALLTMDGVSTTVGAISNGDVMFAKQDGVLFRVIPERIIHIKVL